MAQNAYIDQQMFQVAPLPLTDSNFPFGFDIQIRGQYRKTNWLRINAEQFQKIENILRDIKERSDA